MTAFADNVKEFSRRIGVWMDCHPRTGWYVGVVSTLNVILNIIAILSH